MTTQHTPGPWVYAISAGHHHSVYPTDKRYKDPICHCGWGTDETHHQYKNAEANARLIAASTDLLEALKAQHALNLATHVITRDQSEKVRDMIANAIAKAEGR